MTYWIPFFIGALAATFVVSRLFKFALRRWFSGNRLALLANGLSLAVVTVTAGFGLADGRGFVPLEGLERYAPAQAVILLFDLWRPGS